MDADTAYENLLRAIEAEGYRVLMAPGGKITLERVCEPKAEDEEDDTPIGLQAF